MTKNIQVVEEKGYIDVAKMWAWKQKKKERSNLVFKSSTLIVILFEFRINRYQIHDGEVWVIKDSSNL